MRNPALLARIEAAKKPSSTLGGKEKYIWQPESEPIHRIVLKNARGHAFFEFGEPMLDEPDQVWATPLVSLNKAQHSEFESIGTFGGTAAWAEVGSRTLARQMTGQDRKNGWVVVQPDVYRYAAFQAGTLTVRSVLRNYLATEVFWS